MLPLNDSQRGEIIGLYKNNVPNHKISRILGFHRTTVSRTIKKYLDQKDFTTKNSAGRSKLINKEGQKILKNIYRDELIKKEQIIFSKIFLIFKLK